MKLKLAFITSTILLQACVTSRVEEFMSVEPVVLGSQSIVILTNRQDAVVEAESSFSDCIMSEMSGIDINIISEPQFKDAVFPWFEPRLAPTRPEAVPLLLDDPFISDRVDDMNVRYLVWIHGESEVTNKQGTMSCTLTPAGGGCLGVLSWDNTSNYEASIWDLSEGESLGIISAEATGTSVVPAIGIPIPLLARTKTASCQGLANQLKSVLLRGS